MGSEIALFCYDIAFEVGGAVKACRRLPVPTTTCKLFAQEDEDMAGKDSMMSETIDT